MRWLGFFLIVIVIAVVAVAIGTALLDPNGQNQIVTTIALVFFLVSALTFLSVLFLLLYIPVWFIRLLLRQRSLFGSTAIIQLASLGVATILFPSGVGVPLFRLFNAFLSVINNAVSSLQFGWQATSGLCVSTTTLGDCVSELGFGFLNTWIRALTMGIERLGFNNMPYADIFLWLTAWIAASKVIEILSRPATDEAVATAQSGLSRIMGGVPAYTVKNLIFIGLLLVSGYLSLVSIIAIPDLQTPLSADANVNADTLKQELEEIESQPAPPPFVRPESGPLNELEQQIAANADLKLVFDPLLLVLNRNYNNAAGAAEDLSRAASAARTQGSGQAVDNFVGNSVGRKGVRETAEHYLDLIEWNRTRVSMLDSRVRTCSAAMDSYYARLAAYANETRLFLETLPPDGQFSAATPDQLAQISQDQEAAQSSCAALGAFEPPPDRPNLGSFLGLFGVIAGWLLESESLPMALIVGLLGFGLLGAVASTLIRERVQRLALHDASPSKAYVDDLVGVVVRGTSSAVVVFLAAEGGLALLSADEADPNPYVLLLLCLVAAVFSEAVWNAAQAWLMERLNTMAPGSPDALIPLEPVEGALTDTGATDTTIAADQGASVIDTGAAAPDDPAGAGRQVFDPKLHDEQTGNEK